MVIKKSAKTKIKFKLQKGSRKFMSFNATTGLILDGLPFTNFEKHDKIKEIILLGKKGSIRRIILK